MAPKFSAKYLLSIGTLCFCGCGLFSHQELTTPPAPPLSVSSENLRQTPAAELRIERDADSIGPIRSWIPHFIPTGLACGIMIEFKGVKKDKPLHARYAGIELRRYPPAVTSVVSATEQIGPTISSSRIDMPRYGPFVIGTTINDQKQAFFKVPPGKYLLRQTKEWADQTFIDNVVVREGNYSVVSIPVRIPANTQP